MIKVRIIGTVRGFFKHLLKIHNDDVCFCSQKSMYEVSSKVRTILSSILKTRAVGWLGFFRVIKYVSKENDEDCYLSFNRFVDADKPYMIYLENPTALCNYSLSCINSPFVSRRLDRYINDIKLKKIVCMSDACKNTLADVLKVEIPESKLTRIYPCVPRNLWVTEDSIKKRCAQNQLKLLYVAQGARFYSKGGIEVLESFIRVKEDCDIGLTMITNVDSLEKSFVEKAKSYGVNIFDFRFSYEELEKIYGEHAVLLQPSSDDSFGLTVLEAMKAGMTIIASDMYAFKEMVTDGQNGYLVPPAYRFFGTNDLPNPSVWNNRKNTIYSKKMCGNLVHDLEMRIRKLYEDRELLMFMSLNSLHRSEMLFDEESISKQWAEVSKSIL